jgi:oligopeptide/dipeptide ABC transporter ATP-binding protein
VSLDPRDLGRGTEEALRDRELQDAATDEPADSAAGDAAGAAIPEPDIQAVEAEARSRRAAAIESAIRLRGVRPWPPPKQADPAAPLLEVTDLKTYFSLESGTVHAVDGVSFRLDHGEALGIVGESGCGKTTLALSLVRILPSNGRIASGEVRLMGIDLTKKTEKQLGRYRWREIAIVFQGAMNALNPVRRVVDQIAEPLELRLGESHEAAGRRARELLDLVGIPKQRGSAYPHELSGGMRQRAMIAMALACDPAIVIGDEPTTALDVMVQAQILELLEDLRHKLGLSLILITHDLSVVAETCDRVLIMYAGRVAEEGPVGVVFRRPRHPYTQKLLASFPNIRADRRTLDVIPGSPPDLRMPPPGCRFAPRCAFAMDVCRTVVPPEVTFGETRVACHLYPPGSDGRQVTKPPANAIGPSVPLVEVPPALPPIEVPPA